MNHETAIQTLAVESYLLGDMAPGEREEFEQHFFDCPDCAQDVREAMQLLAVAKPRLEAVAEKPLARREPSTGTEWFGTKWFGWLRPPIAAGAISLLAAACILEAIFIPALRHSLDQASMPRVVASAFLVPQTRGAERVVKAAQGAPLILMLDLPDSASGSLQFVLKTQAGREAFHTLADAPPAGQSVTVSIPRMDLTPGDYVLVVEAPASAGQGGQELSRYPFELQRP